LHLRTPRYIDFERKVLSKLRRSVRDFAVALQSDTRSGLFENSDSFGLVVYRYAGKQAESRSTGEGEVLPLIYGLAGIERKSIADRAPYPGHPLQARTDLAQVWFYFLLPLLVVAGWVLVHRHAKVWPPRSSQAIRSRMRTRRSIHGGM
jgi:ABC-2 type transport system permease protein